MKYLFFLVLIAAGHIPAQGQQGKDPVDVTPAIQQRIWQEIEKEVPAFRQKLVQDGEDDIQVGFSTDTFRVERFVAKWIDTDYRDFGMRDAVHAGAQLYDSLLNKYYQQLLRLLQGDDRKILIQAQKAWVAFRDAEAKLIFTAGKEQYSGGGTIQPLMTAALYMEMIKSRVIAIFDHLVRAGAGQ